MYYLLKDTIVPCTERELTEGQYVAVLTPEEWQAQRTGFDMGIELEPDIRDIHSTKAEVNFDSLTGTFLIPDRSDLTEHSFAFAFALDEKGIVFIDDSGRAQDMIDAIIRTKRWRRPSLERFLYDFLEQIVARDLPIMERFETRLDELEDHILTAENREDMIRVNEIRGQVRELSIHYEQLIDMVQELEENENSFFSEDNLRYIHLFLNRMDRYHATASTLRDHAMQVRDLYREQLEVRQNRTVTLLTVVTTIFMPLTLIVGWYGMNFTNMPELDSPLGYPLVIVVSIAVIVGMLVFFKKKKWL